MIAAEQTFDAVEHAIMQAEKSVFMAYWAFDPELVTVRSNAPETWRDLLYDAAHRGVIIRILISDFDPVLGYEEHKNAWASFRVLNELRESLPPEYRSNLQIVCSRHDAYIGSMVRLCVQPILRSIINALFRPTAPSDQDLQNAPGLWPYIKKHNGTWRPKILTLLNAYPAAHHEKLCVVDDRLCFVGGLDLNRRRLDDIDHTDKKPWHDIASQIDGPVALSFGQHFRARWNRERDDMLARAEALIKHGETLGFDTTLLQSQYNTTAFAEGEHQAEDKQRPNFSQHIRELEKETGGVVPLRTMSSQAKSSFSRTPIPTDTSILLAYEALIDRAEQFIYVETQFLRSSRIIDALIQAKQRSNALKLILLIPLLPERVWDEDDPNPGSRHGHYLQATAIKRLKQAYGADFDVFTLMRSMRDQSYQVKDPSRLVYDHIYVHAKTMIVDDKYAIIGSANLNDRSLFTDTETAIAWHDPAAVQAYRMALFDHAIGAGDQTEKTHAKNDSHSAVNAKKDSPIQLDEWRQIAQRNKAKSGTLTDSFIVPYPDAARDYATRRSLIVPNNLV